MYVNISVITNIVIMYFNTSVIANTLIMSYSIAVIRNCRLIAGVPIAGTARPI